MTKPLDIAVVGGGIVGLAVADAIRRTRADLSLTVLEKEPEVAVHRTGRNSGVIHAGLYYAPGSLKARLCTGGSARLFRVLRRTRHRDHAHRQDRGRDIARSAPGPR